MLRNQQYSGIIWQQLTEIGEGGSENTPATSMGQKFPHILASR
jgi:hypothetical protein